MSPIVASYLSYYPLLYYYSFYYVLSNHHSKKGSDYISWSRLYYQPDLRAALNDIDRMYLIRFE